MPVPTLIERWLPAPTIGAESLRDASAAQKPPINRLHVWWARRPLSSSRAAVVASLLPAWPSTDDVAADVDAVRVRASLEREFPGGEGEYREWFLRFMGILGDPVAARKAIVDARARGTTTEGNAYGYERAFTASPSASDIRRLHRLAAARVNGLYDRTVLDQFAGGGSIPFEAVRFGCNVVANELNPVACAVLAGTITLPLEHGDTLVSLVRRYGDQWSQRLREELDPYFPREQQHDRIAYVWAHAIRCPETGHPTPLLPNSWLANTDKKRVAIKLEGDPQTGEIRRRLVMGDEAGVVGPTGTYKGGKATSLFTGQVIDSETVQASAQDGGLSEILLAIVVTRPGARGRSYRLPTEEDLAAVAAAETAYAEQESRLELDGLLPTEELESGHKTNEPRRMGLMTWSALLTRRQRLVYATAVRELRNIVEEARSEDGGDVARALALLLYFAIGKGLNYNARLNGWHPTREAGANVFDRHDFAFKHTFTELDGARAVWPWAVAQVVNVIADIVKLVRSLSSRMRRCRCEFSEQSPRCWAC